MTASEALASKKLRVSWLAEPPAGLAKAGLVDVLYALARAQRADPPGNSQDETFQILEFITEPVGGWRVRVGYVFDHDYASMYDQTDSFDVEVITDGRTVRLLHWKPR